MSKLESGLVTGREHLVSSMKEPQDILAMFYLFSDQPWSLTLGTTHTRFMLPLLILYLFFANSFFDPCTLNVLFIIQ